MDNAARSARVNALVASHVWDLGARVERPKSESLRRAGPAGAMLTNTEMSETLVPLDYLSGQADASDPRLSIRRR